VYSVDFQLLFPGLCLPPAFTLVSCLAHSSTLKMEVTCSMKCRLIFNRLHSVLSQKIEFFRCTFYYNCLFSILILCDTEKGQYTKCVAASENPVSRVKQM
jgi:hypothetical protein